MEISDNTARTTRSLAIRTWTAEALGATERIEVYLLDPAQEPGNLGTFPLHPYGPKRTTGIHQVKTLAGESAAQLLTLWLGVLCDDEGMQARCHYPIHGLRFFGGKAVLYETSLCWVCNNYFAGTDQGYLWLGLPGALPKGQPTSCCAGLRQMLEALLPIPESLVRKVTDGGTSRDRGRGGYGGSGKRRKRE